jgi:hypothetical protein
MTVCYLEVDDEVTTAINRVRRISDGEVILVVPPGSRIATSRINFKLLAREAAERRLNMAAVSDEPHVRAMAISAGVPTYDTLAAAEMALISFSDNDKLLAARIGKPVDVPNATMVLPGLPRQRPVAPTETSVMPSTGNEHAAVVAARRRAKQRRFSVAPILALGLLALLVGGVAYGAYVFLPTATITITPTTNSLIFPSFTVSADPDVAVADVAAGIVPAERLEIPIHVEGDFAATGIETRETRGAGIVRFRSENTVDEIGIGEGTIVATADGEQFQTIEAVTVPRADFATSTPGTVEVEVRAVRGGPRGNVPAETITVLPNSLAAQLISVRNPQAIEGGARFEDQVVTREDYDAAVTALNAQLPDALAGVAVDPGLIPEGLTAFVETTELGDSTADQPPSAVVGTVAPIFNLGLDATAEMLAVNETLVDDLAAERVTGQLAADQRLVSEQIDSRRSTGRVENGSVVYDLEPSAVVYLLPETSGVVNLVRGKTIDEAEQALARYGRVDIVIWPEFIDRIPDQAARISVSVAPPAAQT